jgi:hypothetical protein
MSPPTVDAERDGRDRDALIARMPTVGSTSEVDPGRVTTARVCALRPCRVERGEDTGSEAMRSRAGPSWKGDHVRTQPIEERVEMAGQPEQRPVERERTVAASGGGGGGVGIVVGVIVALVVLALIFFLFFRGDDGVVTDDGDLDVDVEVEDPDMDTDAGTETDTDTDTDAETDTDTDAETDTDTDTDTDAETDTETDAEDG